MGLVTVADPIFPSPPHDRPSLFFGVITTGGGLYLALAGLQVLPPPGKVNGPDWIAICAGLAFFGAGMAVIVRGWLGMNNQTRELSYDAPLWLKAVYALSWLMAAVATAAISTWVAFGSGTRHFGLSGPIVGPVGEGVGRLIFGIGAVLAWIGVAVMARTAVQKLFIKRPPSRSARSSFRLRS
jgi:hypothetical protein